jgi:hypothetical protein
MNTRKNRKASRKANRKASRKANRKASRKANRKNNRKNNRKTSRKNNRKQRGGAMEYGTQEGFGTMLDSNLRDSAGVAGLDKAINDLSQFHDYGMQRGGRRLNRKNTRKNRKNRKNHKNRKNSRKNSRKQRGGAFGDQFAAVDAPTNLLPKALMAHTHENPQFYNESVVNPNFNGPTNSYPLQ